MDANLKREKPADMLRVEAAYCGDEIVGLRITADDPAHQLLVWADNSVMNGFRIGNEFIAGWDKKIEYRDVAIGEPEPAAPAAPQGTAYAELPEPAAWRWKRRHTDKWTYAEWDGIEAEAAQQMRDQGYYAVELLDLRASNGQAPAGATNTKTHALLSTMIGLFLRAKEKIGYQPGSAIDKTVAEAVEHLKDWPYPETATAQAAPAAGAWIERWHGSGGKDGYEGWSIVNKEGRGLVAYLGRNVESGAVTEIVMAHNATLAAPTAQVAQVAPAGTTLPEGWVSLTITHEGQYAEEVAYGPQRMMDRLGKWLCKYFAKTAAPAQMPDLQPLHNLLYLAQRQNSLGAMRCAITEARLELAKVRDGQKH